MGNAPSHSSEDEAAASGARAGARTRIGPRTRARPRPGPSGPGAAARRGAAGAAPAARRRLLCGPRAPRESLVSRHHALLRWLEERLGRGEESGHPGAVRGAAGGLRGAGFSGERFEEVRTD